MCVWGGGGCAGCVFVMRVCVEERGGMFASALYMIEQERKKEKDKSGKRRLRRGGGGGGKD